MHPEALNEKGKNIFPSLKNFSGFYLAGGTALALQIGHRISIDFDFFSDKYISDNLFDKARKFFSDKKIILSVNNKNELTFFADGVKITFVYYPFPVINSFIEYENVMMLEVKEIAATKLYSIGRRGIFKDYIDLYFVLSENHASLEEIIGLAEKKYGNEFNARLSLEQMVYLDDLEETELLFLKGKIGKQEIEKFFEQEIKKIKI